MLPVSAQAARLFAACAAFALTLATGPMGCGSGTERAQQHVVNAREYLAEEKREAALIELYSAVQFDPANWEANWLLAQIAVSEGNLQEAVFFLREAQRADPEDTRAALELASLLYGSDPKTALKLVNDAIERHPDDAGAHRVLALVAVAMGDTATATRAAKRSVKLGPDDPEAYWTLGWVRQALIRERSLLGQRPQNRDFKTAIEAFDGYVEHGGREPWNARLEQARVYAAWPGRGAKTAETIGLAMVSARASGETGAMRLAAERMSELARGLKSKQLQAQALEMLLEIDPTDLQAWKTLANLRKALGESPAPVYRKMLDSLPEDGDAHILYARHLLHTEGLSAAFAYFDDKVDEGVNPPRMLSAKINLSYATGRSELAAQTLERLEAAYPGDPWTELERAQALIQAHNPRPREALLILDALVTTQPFPEALGFLASAELAAGNSEAAGRAALAALEMGRRFDPVAWNELARALYAAGHYEAAAKLLSDLQRRGTLTDAQQLALARSHYEIGETRNARVALLEMIFRPEPSQAALRTLVEQERRMPKQDGWLRRILEGAHERDPKEFVYLRLLTSLDVQKDRSAEALARLNRSLERWPRSVERLLMRARLADQLERGDLALADARLAFAIKPTYDELGNIILSLHSRYGGAEESIAELERSLTTPGAWEGRNAANSVRRSQLLANLHLLDGDGAAALAVMERANSAKPGNPETQRQLAYLLASTGGDLQRGVALARQAQRGAPRNPETLDTLGFVYFKRGEFPLALGFLRQAIALSATPQPLYHYHESLALQALGRNREALAAIDTVLSLSPKYPGAARVRAKLESDITARTPASS
ncbi:MAG: tetratricopeptide repeat protein [Deltaproteobacteria bacterium]|nr:tetratricopeptide repeat protein [Deltaproteobacteria bacterium]MBW2420301.1 tetratricopeptide repeat protein [Deltaproteobacteria bacterium]